MIPMSYYIGRLFHCDVYVKKCHLGDSPHSITTSLMTIVIWIISIKILDKIYSIFNIFKYIIFLLHIIYPYWNYTT